MSALSAIAQYSSSDSNGSDEDIADTKLQTLPKKVRLPPPQLAASEVPVEPHQDDSSEHGGRVRSFPHERGNWPTFIYIPCGGTDLLERFVAEARRRCKLLQEFETCSDPHISLSRTTVLRYHWINTFTSTLRGSFREFERDELELSAVKVYCNEEQTRSFVALEVNHPGSRQLKRIADKVDLALQDFKLPKYYEEPSFHVSVLWCSGNKLPELSPLLQLLQEALVACANGETYLYIDKIICKCGNKLFQFPLKE